MCVFKSSVAHKKKIHCLFFTNQFVFGTTCLTFFFLTIPQAYKADKKLSFGQFKFKQYFI
jgi:hypothetical protein